MIQETMGQSTQQLQGNINSLVTRIGTVEVDTTVRVEALQRTVTVQLLETVKVVNEFQGQLVAATLESKQTQLKLDWIMSAMMAKESAVKAAAASVPTVVGAQATSPSKLPATTETSNSEGPMCKHSTRPFRPGRGANIPLGGMGRSAFCRFPEFQNMLVYGNS